MFPVILQGTLLGWSVAWPPGPVNLEIVRRGAAGGFAAAFLVGAGAFTGDFLWAILTNTSVAVLAQDPTVKRVLTVFSTAVMFYIAFMMMRGWWRRRHAEPSVANRVERRGNGFLVGLALSFTSPFNAAFWLAVAGQGMSLGGGMGTSLLLALSVSFGAAVWVVILSTMVSVGRARLAGRWMSYAEPIAASLMLFFAVRSLLG